MKCLIEADSVDPMIIMEFTYNWVAFTLRYVVGYKQRRFNRGRSFNQILEEIERINRRVAVASSTFEVVGVIPALVKIHGEPS